MNWLMLKSLLPLIIVSATSIAVMLAAAITRRHRLTARMTAVGLVLAVVSLWWIAPGLPQQVTPLVIMDDYAVFYMGLILLATLAVTALGYSYIDGYESNREEFYVLLLLATLGACVLAASSHFASFFLGLELLSVSLFGLIAYPVRYRRPLEAGIKYLILSAVASAFLLFGMALIYARLGTMDFAQLALLLAGQQNLADPYLLTGAAMLVVGIGFKLSVAPFHLWTPDVFEGAPAPVAAYLSTVSKGAVFALLLRYIVVVDVFHTGALLAVFSFIAVLSIMIGNLLALMQNNVKRMLAYSSIAHFGYLLVALVASGPLAAEAVGIYLVTYFVTSLGAFGVVTLVSSPIADRDADAIWDYRGLFWRRPFLTVVFTPMLLSLAGIPLTAGFMGKFYVVAAGVDSNLWGLLAAVVLGSAIGLFYYLRLMIVMFYWRKEDMRIRRRKPAGRGRVVAAFATLFTLFVLMFWLGIYPQPFITLIQTASASLL